MSNPAMTWAQQQTAGSPGRKATLLLLADVASEHGVLWAGVDYLAEILECNRSTTIEHLKRLEVDGLIMRIERRKKNGARAGTITVLGPRGDRGSMRDPVLHELHGEAIAQSLGRESQHGDSVEPKSEILASPGRESRPEPSVEPSANQEDADASSSPIDPEVARLCKLLASLILERDPKAKVQPESQRWLDAMRLLLKDRVGDIGEVERVLRWSQQDGFWRGNILSPSKLRQQFTQLREHAGRVDGRRLSPGQRPKVAVTAGPCPGVDAAAGELWERASSVVKQAIGDEQFDVWFGDAHAHGVETTGDERRLLVALPPDGIAWAKDRYAGLLTSAAESIASTISLVGCRGITEAAA